MGFENLKSLAARSAKYLDAAKDNLKILSAGVYEGGRTLVKNGMAAFEEEEVEQQRRRNAARAGHSPANEDPAAEQKTHKEFAETGVSATVSALKAKIKSLEEESTPTMALLQEYQYLLKSLQDAQKPELKKGCKPGDDFKEPELMYEVLSNGCRRYRVLSSLEMLAMNFEVLTRLRTALQIDDEYFDSRLLPVIIRFADYVSVVPASEANHDISAGGLVRHTLLCCMEAQCALRFKEAHLNCRDFRLLLFSSTLLHDIGKLLTDMKICSPQGEHYLPYKEPLSVFTARTGSDYILIKFLKSRYGHHEKDSEDKTAVSRTILQPLLSELERSELWLAQLEDKERRDAELRLQTITATADGSAVRFTRNQSANGLNFPFFIFASLYEYLQAIGFTGYDLQQGLFWTNEGLIVSSDSPLKEDLMRKYNALFDIRDVSSEKEPLQKRFLDDLKTYSVTQQPGLYALSYWHKIFSGADLIYVHGIAFSLPNKMKKFPLECEQLQSIGRGSKPEELKPVLEILEQDKSKVHVIILKNSAAVDGLNMLNCFSQEQLRDEFTVSDDGIKIWILAFPEIPQHRANVVNEGSMVDIIMDEQPLFSAAEPYYYCKDHLLQLTTKLTEQFEAQTAQKAASGLPCAEHVPCLIDKYSGLLLTPMRSNESLSRTDCMSKAALSPAWDFEGTKISAAISALFKAARGSLMQPLLQTPSSLSTVLEQPPVIAAKYFDLPGCAAAELKTVFYNFIESIALTVRPDSRLYVFPNDDPFAGFSSCFNAAALFNFGRFVEPYYSFSQYFYNLRVCFRCLSEDFELCRNFGRILNELHEIYSVNPASKQLLKRKRTIRTPPVQIYAPGNRFYKGHDRRTDGSGKLEFRSK